MKEGWGGGAVIPPSLHPDPLPVTSTPFQLRSLRSQWYLTLCVFLCRGWDQALYIHGREEVWCDLAAPVISKELLNGGPVLPLVSHHPNLFTQFSLLHRPAGAIYGVVPACLHIVWAPPVLSGWPILRPVKILVCEAVTNLEGPEPWGKPLDATGHCSIRLWRTWLLGLLVVHSATCPIVALPLLQHRDLLLEVCKRPEQWRWPYTAATWELQTLHHQR